MTVKERLIERVKTLSEEDAARFLDEIEGSREPPIRTEAERRAAVRALRGSCRGARPGLEDFLREKREETAREELRLG